MVQLSRPGRQFGLELARVLIVDKDPASRLTLQTVLEAGGYRVDAASTAAEAVGKLEQEQYELVLSDLQMESPAAGLRVLTYAKLMYYEPATALLTTWQNSVAREQSDGSMLIATEDIPGLLTKVAHLISKRATRRVDRELQAAPSN
jgi:CheY-like chemotaxis protein